MTEWAVRYTSDLFGASLASSYNTKDEAIAGANQIRNKCKTKFPEVDRSFELGTLDDEGEFIHVEDLESYEGASGTNAWVCVKNCMDPDIYGPFPSEAEAIAWGDENLGPEFICDDDIPWAAKQISKASNYIGSFDLEPYDDVGESVKVTLERGIGDFTLIFSFSGYGDMTSVDGHGKPVVVDLEDGHPRFAIWGDINTEDYTHSISIANAAESKRLPEEDF